MARRKLEHKFPDPNVAPPPVESSPPPPVEKCEPPPTVTAALTRCPRCGSTNRTPYVNRREVDFAGESEGQPFTHVVWRNTACADCGQNRVDRHYENRRQKPGDGRTTGEAA